MLNSLDLLSQRYFHELNERDKIFARLPLSFAIYTSLLTLLAYMVKALNYNANSIVLTLFFIGVISSLVLLAVSMYYTIVALTGHKYKTLPKSIALLKQEEQLEQYTSDITKYNQEYGQTLEVPDAKIIFHKQLAVNFADCIDYNYQVNEFRRQAIKKSIWYTILSSIAFVEMIFLFIVFNLDLSSSHKTAKVSTQEQPAIIIVNSLSESK